MDMHDGQFEPGEAAQGQESKDTSTEPETGQGSAAAGETRPAAGGESSASEGSSPEFPEPDVQDAMELPVKSLTTGQIVDGLIVHIDHQGALVDVGTKSEGHISASDLSSGTSEEGKPLEVGDRVSVYVVRPEDEDGSPVISKKRADYELVWKRITNAHEQGELLSAMVTDRVKGGLVVDLGLRGFLPASHVRTRNVHALDRFVGQSLKVKIIEVDRGRKRVVVSQKEAIEESRRQRREKTLASLEEGKVCRGVVRRITDYGAFVDLGGLDGLLHITEMSWTRINHPSDVVKVGQRTDVMVLRFDRERNRISLGLRQILPDPWNELDEHFKVGQTVSGEVSRVVPFGAFVRLENGIEGIIPNAELPGGRGQRAQDMLTKGQSVQVKIINMRPAERRMTLSLRQVEQARERREMKEYLDRQEESSRVTIGDLFGSVLSETQAAREQEREEAVSDQEARESGEARSAEEAQSAVEAAADAETAADTETAAPEAVTRTQTSEGGEEHTAAERAEPEGEADEPERAAEAVAGEAPSGAAEAEQAEEEQATADVPPT